MVQSDRSPDRKRPKKGPRPSDGAPRPGASGAPRQAKGAAPPARRPAPPGPPGPPQGPVTGTPTPPRRRRPKPVRRAPKRKPAAPATPSPGAAPGGATATAPPKTPELKIERPPVWRVAWNWLREDPDKNARETERDRAVRQVEAASEARRKAYLREQLQKAKLGIVAGAIVGDADAPADAPEKPAPATPDHRLWTRSEDSPPNRFAALIHKLLGERAHTRGDGERVIVPPPKTDWRWSLHHFFRSNQRAVVYARSLLVTLLVVSTMWFSVLQYTGFDLMDHMDPVDPEDERSRFRTPFFIIESGSMMHRDAAFGRLGTVDPGDLVVIEKVRSREHIETFYGDGTRKVAGAKGDVIMFLPFSETEEGSDPIIHRAMAYVHREEVPVPNPDKRAGAPPTVLAVRFTVAEFGIFEAGAINIPELGLRNYQPTMSGYITRGDNDRSNNWADQALGVTPYPVPEDRIIGRMKAEVPYIGLAKIALSGQDPRLISADEAWCSFLAGKAACDTWLVFFAIVIVFVGVPLTLTLFVFGRRVYVRHLDRLATRRAQEAELERRAALQGAAGTSGRALPPHDAADLLSGAVVVEGAPRRRGPTPWQELTRSGTIRHVDARDPEPRS